MGKTKMVEDVAGIGETAQEKLNGKGFVFAYQLLVSSSHRVPQRLTDIRM
jgi:hypothetical protein